MLFSFAKAVVGPLGLCLTHGRVVIRSIRVVCGIVINSDTTFKIASSPVWCKAKAELAWFLGVDGNNVNISFDVVCVGRWHLFINFPHEKRPSLGQVLLFRLYREVHLLLLKCGLVPICIGEMATHQIWLEPVKLTIHVNGRDRTVS